jgi:hypothetical protein
LPETAAADNSASQDATIQAQGRPGLSFGSTVRRPASVPQLGGDSSTWSSSSAGGNFGIHRRARGDQDSPNNVPFKGTNNHNTPGPQDGSSNGDSSTPGMQAPTIPDSSSRPGVAAPGQQNGGDRQDGSIPGSSPNGGAGWGNSGNNGGSNGGNRGGSWGPHGGEQYYGGHQTGGDHWYGNPNYNNQYGGGQYDQYGGGQYGGDGQYGPYPGGPGDPPEQWTCTACNQERNYMLRMMPDGTQRCGKALGY